MKNKYVYFLLTKNSVFTCCFSKEKKTMKTFLNYLEEFGLRKYITIIKKKYKNLTDEEIAIISDSYVWLHPVKESSEFYVPFELIEEYEQLADIAINIYDSSIEFIFENIDNLQLNKQEYEIISTFIENFSDLMTYYMENGEIGEILNEKKFYEEFLMLKLNP